MKVKVFDTYMVIRVIYMIEAFDEFGNLTMRRYARNRRTADRIRRFGQKKYFSCGSYEVPQRDWGFINPDWVEG